MLLLTVPEISTLLTSGAAIIASGAWLAQIGIKQAERRKLLADTADTQAKTANSTAATILGTAGELIDELRKEITRLRKDRDDACTREDVVQARLSEVERKCVACVNNEESCKQKLSQALDRLARLELGKQTI